jgi:hypothetical protein
MQVVQTLVEGVLVMLLLYQIFAHIEDKEKMVFHKPTRAQIQVSLLFNIVIMIVCSRVLVHGSNRKIISSYGIHGRVLFHSGSRIMSRVLLMKRDFLFHNASYLDWLLERGGGATV